MRDLLVTPLQRFTRYPLILKNMEKRSCTEAEESALQGVVELVDRAIGKYAPLSVSTAVTSKAFLMSSGHTVGLFIAQN